MRISEERIKEFKQIYRDTYGEDLSDERAYELALQLLQFFKVIYRPLPSGHRCRACSPEKADDFDKNDTSA